MRAPRHSALTSQQSWHLAQVDGIVETLNGGSDTLAAFDDDTPQAKIERILNEHHRTMEWRVLRQLVDRFAFAATDTPAVSHLQARC